VRISSCRPHWSAGQLPAIENALIGQRAHRNRSQSLAPLFSAEIPSPAAFGLSKFLPLDVFRVARFYFPEIGNCCCPSIKRFLSCNLCVLSPPTWAVVSEIDRPFIRQRDGGQTRIGRPDRAPAAVCRNASLICVSVPLRYDAASASAGPRPKSLRYMEAPGPKCTSRYHCAL